MGVDHLSVYDLQYEPGTPFGRSFPVPGHGGRPSAEGAAEMYEAVCLGLMVLALGRLECSS